MGRLIITLMMTVITTASVAQARYNSPAKPLFSDQLTQYDDPYLGDYYNDEEYPALPNEFNLYNPKSPGGLLKSPIKRPAFKAKDFRPITTTTEKPKIYDANRKLIEPTNPAHQFQMFGQVKGCKRIGQDRLDHSGTESSIENRHSKATGVTIEIMEPVYVDGGFGYETLGDKPQKVTYQTNSSAKTYLQLVWYGC